MRSLGEGNTSKVYLGRSLQNANSLVAIKIMRDEFLQRDENSLRSVENEITILKNMKHQGIVQMLDYGDNGQVLKPSGRVIPSLIYIVMEYVEGGLLFDLCQLMQAMGEDSGRFFAHQMLNSIEYLHSIRVVHRDLKLENLLVDSHLNLKVADFGFASYKNIDCLKSYRGTMTYMAPEIKEGKPYKGTQVDLFSFGVILFILVHGIFPFKEARTEEYFYNLIVTGQTDLYFITPQTAFPLLAANKLRALAVTSNARLAALPDVPTVAESGYPGFEASAWTGLVGPAGMSADMVNQLNARMQAVLKEPAVVKRLEDEGSQPLGGTPADFEAYMKSETAKWADVVKAANIKLD